MSKGIALGIILVLVLSIAGCSSTPSKIKATWATPTVNGDTVSIPASTVNSKNNVHFRVNSGQGPMGFVAYTLKGATQVRARLCVPCRGESFTLSGDELVCDTCGTVFSASTGNGIRGVPVCQSYTKVSVPFTTTADGNITMKMADLQTAFNKTVNRLP